MKRNSGFTLIELMVTIVVLGIVAAIAVPNLSSVINSNRLSGAATDLFSAVSIARSEAIKNNATVTLAKKGDSWAKGWTVTYTQGGETVTVLDKNGIPSSISIGSSSSSESVTFNSNGYSRSNHWGNKGVVFCNDSNNGRKVDIFPSGSVKVEKVTCS